MTLIIKRWQRQIFLKSLYNLYNTIFSLDIYSILVSGDGHSAGGGTQDVQICDLIHKSVNWQRPLVLPAWWPPTIWIFYFIIKIELGNTHAGHHAESTRFSDLWLYWVTDLLTGTVPWFSLLDGHPTKWTTH